MFGARTKRRAGRTLAAAEANAKEPSYGCGDQRP